MTVRIDQDSYLTLDESMLSMLGRVHVNMPWKFLPRYIEPVLQLGMNVEIGFEAEELDRISRSEARAIAERLQKRGCRTTLHGPFWDLAPGSRDPLVRRISSLRLQQFFDLIGVFNPVQVVCHTGYDPRHHQDDTVMWIERSLSVWEPLVERAESLNVFLLLENVWEHGPEFHREILGSINSPRLGFCLDVGHQHSFSNTTLREWLEALSDYLGEVHLHDNDGTCDAHLPVGDGSIDFSLLFEFLKAKAKMPLLTLEPHREEHLVQSLAGLVRVMARAGW
jgi:sugar phosphate isomerase/epimerase